MGYYTQYQLDVRNVGQDILEQLLSDLENLHVFDASYHDKDCICSNGYAKWYDYEDDLLNLSAKYPTCFFELDGDGEDDDDIWRAYFRDGMTMRCQGYIQRQYERFDEALMVRRRPPAEAPTPCVELEDLV